MSTDDGVVVCCIVRCVELCCVGASCVVCHVLRCAVFLVSSYVVLRCSKSVFSATSREEEFSSSMEIDSGHQMQERLPPGILKIDD